jgi:hypothetical protein
MTRHLSPCWLPLFRTISYADCSLSRLSSSRPVGCVVREVVGCWAESLANQQRIARDSDQGLRSESREKKRHTRREPPTKTREEEREKGTGNEQEKKEKKERKENFNQIGKQYHKLLEGYAAWAAIWAAPAMAFWVMSPMDW